jgi:hypothetical protein
MNQLIPTYLAEDAPSSYDLLDRYLADNKRFLAVPRSQFPIPKTEQSYERAARILSLGLEGPAIVIVDMSILPSSLTGGRAEATRDLLGEWVRDRLRRQYTDSYLSGLALVVEALRNEKWYGVLALATTESVDIAEQAIENFHAASLCRENIEVMVARHGFTAPERRVKEALDEILARFDARFGDIAPNLLRDLVETGLSRGETSAVLPMSLQLLEDSFRKDPELHHALFSFPVDSRRQDLPRPLSGAAFAKILNAAGLEVTYRRHASTRITLPVAPGAVFIYALIDAMRNSKVRKAVLEVRGARVVLNMQTPLAQQIASGLSAGVDKNQLVRIWRDVSRGGYTAAGEAIASMVFGVARESAELVRKELLALSENIEQYPPVEAPQKTQLRISWDLQLPHSASRTISSIQLYKPKKLEVWFDEGRMDEFSGEEEVPFGYVARIGLTETKAFREIRGDEAFLLQRLHDRALYTASSGSIPNVDTFAQQISEKFKGKVSAGEILEKIYRAPKGIVPYAEVCVLLISRFDRNPPTGEQTLKKLAQLLMDGFLRTLRDEEPGVDTKQLIKHVNGQGYQLHKDVKPAKLKPFEVGGMTEYQKDVANQHHQTGSRRQLPKKTD